MDSTAVGKTLQLEAYDHFKLKVMTPIDETLVCSLRSKFHSFLEGVYTKWGWETVYTINERVPNKTTRSGILDDLKLGASIYPSALDNPVQFSLYTDFENRTVDISVRIGSEEWPLR